MREVEYIEVMVAPDKWEKRIHDNYGSYNNHGCYVVKPEYEDNYKNELKYERDYYPDKNCRKVNDCIDLKDTINNYCKNVKAAIDDIIEHGEDEYPHINNIKPNYYKTNSIYEPFKIIDFYGLDFYSGNVLKYLLRAGKKDDKKEIEDLKKAITYIEKKIELLESKTNED